MADLESWTVGLQQGGPLYFHSASSLQIANLPLIRNKINIYIWPAIDCLLKLVASQLLLSMDYI